MSRSGGEGALPRGVHFHKKDGYLYEYCPEHPRAMAMGYVAQHILVFERETGIRIPPNCVVHHLNGIRDDNRIENLCMMERGAHVRFHHKGATRSEEARKHISEAAKARREREKTT